MRRILRKIVAGEGDQLGDLSSIADPSIVDESESSSEPWLDTADIVQLRKRLAVRSEQLRSCNVMTGYSH